MRRTSTIPLVLGLTAGLFWSPAALAQDDWSSDDDFSFEGEDEPETDEDRLEEGDDLDTSDEEQQAEEELDEFMDPDEDAIDLLGDEEPVAESGDTPADYRKVQEEMQGSSPDEEIQAWETYLATYPNTPFRDRINKRIAKLEEEMYSGGILDDTGPVDAMDQEIHFAQALQLENIDPRTRLQVGVEWGLPDYINPFIDYEHQINRKFSAHAGFKRRYTGYSIEPGVRWAMVKSTRTQTLFTFIGDFHVNANPAWFGFRPQLALGKRIGDAVDLQIQGGPDLELRSFDSGMPVRIIGGASVTYNASDTVKVFLDTAWNMKEITRDGGFFRYNTATFGMKFFPKKDKRTEETSEDIEVNAGATVPYSYNYWTYHYGSVMVQGNMYL